MHVSSIRNRVVHEANKIPSATQFVALCKQLVVDLEKIAILVQKSRHGVPVNSSATSLPIRTDGAYVHVVLGLDDVEFDYLRFYDEGLVIGWRSYDRRDIRGPEDEVMEAGSFAINASVVKCSVLNASHIITFEAEIVDGGLRLRGEAIYRFIPIEHG